MSDPTYRIDTEHRPWEAPGIRWVARIIRLSDEAFQTSIHRECEEEAVAIASAWIKAQCEQQPGRSFYVGDDGRPVAAHSVKA